MWIVHTEYHPWVHQHIIIDHKPGIDITAAQSHTTVPQIDTEEVDLDHNHTIKGTAANVAITPSDHILGHTTKTTGDLTGVVHTSLTTTPCIEDPPLIEAYQPFHEIVADHTLGQPIGQLRKPHIRIYPIPEDPVEIRTVGRIQESP